MQAIVATAHHTGYAAVHGDHTMKPMIGIVADVNRGSKHPAHSVQEKYIDAVTAGADAIGLILPAFIARPGSAWTSHADLADTLAMLDGVFLPGALSNVAPERYGASLENAASPADPARDHVSLSLVELAVARGVPVLGVCRGFQEINVALGGTLHQQVHLSPGLDDHREKPDLSLEGQYGPSHAISLTPGGLLHALSGLEETRVNSLHGQGVDRLAPGLAVEAVAPDGLIEAFRLDRTDNFLLGVQWHPEWAFRENPLSTAILRAFGMAARAHQAARRAQPARHFAHA
jgi:putative glutamine amidotransferase